MVSFLPSSDSRSAIWRDKWFSSKQFKSGDEMWIKQLMQLFTGTKWGKLFFKKWKQRCVHRFRFALSPSSWGSHSCCGSRGPRWGCAVSRSATGRVPERCCWSSHCDASSSLETAPCSPYCPWPPEKRQPPNLDCEEEKSLLGGWTQRRRRRWRDSELLKMNCILHTCVCAYTSTLKGERQLSVCRFFFFYRVSLQTHSCWPASLSTVFSHHALSYSRISSFLSSC